MYCVLGNMWSIFEWLIAAARLDADGFGFGFDDADSSTYARLLQAPT